jgi:putative transposase
MRRIKGRASTKPQLKKRYWRQHFWARGYFCVTAGELTRGMIKEYLEHHLERKPNNNFEVE